MALVTIQGATFPEFMTNFITAVEGGGRFKTCNYSETEDKPSITLLEDYNFFTNVEGLHDITGDGAYLLDIEDTYILPNVTILVPSAYSPELTLGAYLMMIQHTLTDTSFTVDAITQPAKSRIPAFVGRANLVNNGCFGRSTNWQDFGSATHVIENGLLIVTSPNNDGVSSFPHDAIPVLAGENYTLDVEVVSMSGSPSISLWDNFPSGTPPSQSFALAVGSNSFNFTAQGAGVTVYIRPQGGHTITLDCIRIMPVTPFGHFPYTFPYQMN